MTSRKKEFDADYEYFERKCGLPTVIIRARNNYLNAIRNETYHRGPHCDDRKAKLLDDLWWDPEHKRESAYHKDKLTYYENKLKREQSQPARAAKAEPVKTREVKQGTKRKISKDCGHLPPDCKGPKSPQCSFMWPSPNSAGVFTQADHQKVKEHLTKQFPVCGIQTRLACLTHNRPAVNSQTQMDLTGTKSKSALRVARTRVRA